jgi:hypothetical protein
VIKQSFYVRNFPVAYIKNRYKKLFGVIPNLENPITFSEKIQWLKLNYRDKLMVQCADKILVRDFVKRKIGDGFLNDLLFVYDGTDDIDFSALPNEFVFKPNNSSGRIIICKDKSIFNKTEAIKIMKKWEKENLFYLTGEWIYKDIPYKLICEKFLEDNITDYKLYFAYEEFIATQVISDRHNQFFIDFYDENWNLLDIRRHDHPNSKSPMKKPQNYDVMIEKGSILAKSFPFSRIDFYNINGKIYLGEISFFPNNGFIKYMNSEMDRFFADRIRLPSTKEKTV